MGLDMQGFSREEGSDELPPGLSKANMATPPSSPPPPKPAPSPSSSKPVPTPAAEPEDVEMAEEDQEEAQAKKEAEAAKKVGNEAYKKRDFETAAENFQKAWDIWPKDVSFLTNLGGVFILQMGVFLRIVMLIKCLLNFACFSCIFRARRLR